jgi:capsular polysaccharide biosynthesis protein
MTSLFLICLILLTYYFLFYRLRGFLKPDQLKSICFSLPVKSYAIIIPNGIALGRDGDLLTENLWLVPSTSIHSDTSLRPGNQLLGHHLFKKPHFLWPRRYSSTIAVIASGASNCYFHWMFEILPKFYLLELSGLPYDQLYLPEIVKDFQRQTLNHLKIDYQSAVQATRKTQVQARKLIGFQLPTSSLRIPQWVLKYLQQKFISSSDSYALTHFSKLYVARKKELPRAIHNELNLIAALNLYGFELIYAEDYTILEQAKFFFQAEFLVIPHGSGLVNITFCQPKTKVLELGLPLSHHFNCYQQLAHTLELNYHCLHCEYDEQKENLIAPIEAIHKHFLKRLDRKEMKT